MAVRADDADEGAPFDRQRQRGDDRPLPVARP
jgi:hypothetical protein